MVQLCAKQTTVCCPEPSVCMRVKPRRKTEINRLKAVIMIAIKSKTFLCHEMRAENSSSSSDESLGGDGGFRRHTLVAVGLRFGAAPAGRPPAQPALFLWPRTLVRVQLAYAHLDARIARHVPTPGVRLVLIRLVAFRSLRLRRLRGF